jgi:protein transport protein SEC13
VADLVGHQGPVYQVAFSNPKHGAYLASASFDGTIIIWQNTNNDSVTWQQVFQASNENGAAVNSVAWAPYGETKMLAGACADGSILIAELQHGSWVTSSIPHAHDIGALGVTFAPHVGQADVRKRLASCGCDGTIKVWTFDERSTTWVQEGPHVVGHADWVRSVDWAPATGLNSTATIVSAGQDGKVVVWKSTGRDWSSTCVVELDKAVFSARWNGNGSMVAVTDADQAVTLYKEVGDRWMQV